MEPMRRQLLVGGALLLGSTTLSLFAAEIYPKASRKTSQALALDAKTLIARLDQLLTEEQQMFQALEDMKRELAIVKVRASTPKPCQ